MHSKAGLRQGILEQLRRLGAAPPRASERVLDSLFTMLKERRPSVVAGYMALNAEVDIRRLLEEALDAGCHVWLPRYCREAQRYEMIPVQDMAKDLVPGWYGIQEPSPHLSAVDDRARMDRAVLWLVPGLAFDPEGHRLGRGKGYYDRILAGTRGRHVGICWDWQLVESIPSEAHDVSMDRVVTDMRTICCQR